VATGLAAALLVAGLVLRWPLVIPVTVALLAAPYTAVLAFEQDSLDARAPVLAAVLFSLAELAYWSLERRGTLADEPGTQLRRVSLLATLVGATVVGGTGILALVAETGARGPAVDLLGAAAALGALALLALAAARRTG
jgi:hypothetical protein